MKIHSTEETFLILYDDMHIRNESTGGLYKLVLCKYGWGIFVIGEKLTQVGAIIFRNNSYWYYKDFCITPLQKRVMHFITPILTPDYWQYIKNIIEVAELQLETYYCSLYTTT